MTNLPQTVTVKQIGDKTYYLVGTAHVSPKSVEDVRETIEKVRPDSVAIELCPSRYKALREKDTWKKMNIFKVIKEGKALFLLFQLLMTSFYQKLGEKLGVMPGAELIAGADAGEALGVPVILADREIEITMKRVWRGLGFWEKIKLLSQVITGIFEVDDIEQEMIEEIKDSANMDDLMEMFAKSFPKIKERLIDERDAYLAEKIRSCPGQIVVAVVGAGHIKGILPKLEEITPLAPLMQVPPPSKIGKVLKWAIPLGIIAIPIYGLSHGMTEKSIESISLWVASHSLLAGIGAALAFAHPLSIAASAAVAPFTSLNPMIAAGWLGGLVQAWIKKPTVEDLERVPNEIKTLQGFWRNPATRILLVVVLVNLGSSLATFVSGTWILSRFLA